MRLFHRAMDHFSTYPSATSHRQDIPGFGPLRGPSGRDGAYTVDDWLPWDKVRERHAAISEVAWHTQSLNVSAYDYLTEPEDIRDWDKILRRRERLAAARRRLHRVATIGVATSLAVVAELSGKLSVLLAVVVAVLLVAFWVVGWYRWYL